MTTSANYEFRSELLRNVAEGGKTLGQAQSILVVLEGRDIAVPDHVRDQILECTDADRLRVWLLRAGTAATADEVIRE